jgi:hypothetical protein
MRATNCLVAQPLAKHTLENNHGVRTITARLSSSTPNAIRLLKRKSYSSR